MKCPGQDTQYWDQEAIFEAKCPECDHVVEFFKDDTTRKCDQCDHRFVNPKMDFGCAAYCQYADQCVGNLPPELLAEKEDFLKDRVAVEMKRYFKTDFKRIGRATRVARHAERIGKAEGANIAVVLSAAYLNDIDNQSVSAGDNGPSFRSQVVDEPSNARALLEKLGAPEGLISEVCVLITQPDQPQSGQQDKSETLNSKVLNDAKTIENLDEKRQTGDINKEALLKIIEETFLTKSGKAEAQKVFLEKTSA